MELIILKYENIFKLSQKNSQDFLKENNMNFQKELAQSATDTIHNSIIKGIESDQSFILSIQKLKTDSINKLMQSLKAK